MREALGSPHVESRRAGGPSRATLLRLSQPDVSARVRDIDDADAILVVGTDPLHSSPILDLRVRKAMRRNGAKLAVATDRPTALDGGARAVTRYAPGGATSFLSRLVEALTAAGTPSSLGGRREESELSRGAGGADSAKRSEGVPAAVADTLRAAKRVVVIWGERIAREQGAAEALLDVAAALGLSDKEGSGLLEIPDLTNARGLREAGCLPDAGPGLLETPAGKSTEEIRAALESGELKSLILFGADPLRDFPDTKAWEAALGAADFVVSFSMFDTATTAKADVVFPLETHAEKDGTVTHPDGRLQRVRPSAARPGDIRPNLLVLAELSTALGDDHGLAAQPAVFAALTEAVPFYSGITDSDIGGRGVRWQDRPDASSLPVPEDRPVGGDTGIPSERFAESAQTTMSDGDSVSGRLPREEGVPASPAAEGVPDAPAALTLGTYRDLWAGPITELNPALRFLEPQQRVEMSPADAERLGLKSSDEVKVGQNGSSVQARVSIKERVATGVCFLVEGTATDNANRLLNGGPVAVEIVKVGS